MISNLPGFQQKVGSGTFETGFPPARFAAVWPLTLLAFGRYQQILDAEPPKQCQVEPFLAGWGKAAEIHGDMMGQLIDERVIIIYNI